MSPYGSFLVVAQFRIMSIGSYIKDKWPEFLVLVVVSGLGYQVFFDIRDRLVRVEESNSLVNTRMEKIAEVLPESPFRNVLSG
jgi:hypothetical protein